MMYVPNAHAVFGNFAWKQGESAPLAIIIWITKLNPYISILFTEQHTLVNFFTNFSGLKPSWIFKELDPNNYT